MTFELSAVVGKVKDFFSWTVFSAAFDHNRKERRFIIEFRPFPHHLVPSLLKFSGLYKHRRQQNDPKAIINLKIEAKQIKTIDRSFRYENGQKTDKPPEKNFRSLFKTFSRCFASFAFIIHGAGWELMKSFIEDSIS